MYSSALSVGIEHAFQEQTLEPLVGPDDVLRDAELGGCDMSAIFATPPMTGSPAPRSSSVPAVVAVPPAVRCRRGSRATRGRRGGVVLPQPAATTATKATTSMASSATHIVFRIASLLLFYPSPLGPSQAAGLLTTVDTRWTRSLSPPPLLAQYATRVDTTRNGPQRLLGAGAPGSCRRGCSAGSGDGTCSPTADSSGLGISPSRTARRGSPPRTGRGWARRPAEPGCRGGAGSCRAARLGQLHDPPQIHHRHPVAHVPHYSRIKIKRTSFKNSPFCKTGS